jgi:hypothetical protein
MNSLLRRIFYPSTSKSNSGNSFSNQTLCQNHQSSPFPIWEFNCRRISISLWN